jgi:hypothetical protein
MARGEIERDDRAAVIGTDKFHAEILNEGDVVSKCVGLRHGGPAHPIIAKLEGI